MTDLESRLAALERTLTEEDVDCSALAEGAATADRVQSLEVDLTDLQEEVEELQAATQALRGYVGNVRSVNEEVEQRADAALAKVEVLEAREPTGTPPDTGTGSSAQQGSVTAEFGTEAETDAADSCRACGRPHETEHGRLEDGWNGADGPAARRDAAGPSGQAGRQQDCRASTAVAPRADGGRGGAGRHESLGRDPAEDRFDAGDRQSDRATGTETEPGDGVMARIRQLL